MRRDHNRQASPAHDIVIVGGGIAGLAAAHRLVELRRKGGANVRVHVLEASDHLGGIIRTRKEHGCLLEAGPDSMITDKPWGVDLCRRLGLGDALIGTDERHRRSFVVHRGKLVPAPEGFYLMTPMKWGPFLKTPLLSWGGKFRAAKEWWVPRRQETSDESLGQFVRRRFGRELFDRLAEPMLGGIYAADPDELSLNATFPKFAEMERNHGSVLRGLRQSPIANRQSSLGVSGARYSLFVTLKNGMGSLVEALVKALPNGSVRTQAKVTQLEKLPEGKWKVGMEKGSPLVVDAVILAVPPYAAAHLVLRFDPYLAQELEGILYGSSATVNLVYRRREIPHPLDGFGFVCPSAENRAILGCTFCSVKFPSRAPAGWVVLRAFLGGASLDDQRVAGELKELLGIKVVPSFTWGNRFEKSMPHYRVGHLDRLRRIEDGMSRLKGLVLAGNGYRGIGLPDCIHSGEQAAEFLVQALKDRH